MHQYKHKKIRIFRIKLFRSTVCFFLTDTCIGIIKSSGVRKFSPNNKFPDKSSAGLTRLDCNKYFTSESASWAARLFTSVPRRLFWLWSSLFWRCDSSNLPFVAWFGFEENLLLRLYLIVLGLQGLFLLFQSN